MLRFLLGLTRMGGIRNGCRSEGQLRLSLEQKLDTRLRWFGCVQRRKMLNVEGEIEADEKEREMFWIVQTIWIQGPNSCVAWRDAV